MPVTALNTVVLPAPLGPMIEKISPSLTARSSPLTAVTPPKRMVRFLISRRATGILLRRRHQAVRDQHARSRDRIFVGERLVVNGACGLFFSARFFRRQQAFRA